MTSVKITKREVDATKPNKAERKDVFLWDTNLKGFGLKVTPAGGKVYIYQYRIAQPGQAARTAAKRFTIGKHGSVTPDQARDRAKQLAALVANGIDPRDQYIAALAAKNEAKRLAADKARLEGELTFEKVAALWLHHYENEKDRRPSSVRLAKMVVNNHLSPKLKRTPMPYIGRADLRTVLDSIPSSQRATRRTVFAYASVLFGWAAKRGDIPGNPLTQMLKPQAPKARDRVLGDNELRQLWEASESVAAPFGPFFRLLLATGQRRAEVAGMRWDELDWASATWTIPLGRAKNRQAHIVPLSPLVVAELDRLAGQGWPHAGYVLTTTGKTPISGFSKGKAALDAAIAEANEGKALPGWRVHDIRRTVATGFQRLGIRFEVTEAVLNHVSGSRAGVAGIYQRHDWKAEKRDALNAWARHVEGLVTQSNGSNVVALQSAKA